MEDKLVEINMVEFSANWKRTSIVYEFLEGTNMADTEEWSLAYHKACILSCIGKVAGTFDVPDLRFQLKPIRSVYANRDYGPNALQLLPITTRIGSSPKALLAQHSNHKHISRFQVGSGTDVVYYLQPQVSAEAVSYAWGIRNTDDKSKANCVIKLEHFYVQMYKTTKPGKDADEGYKIPIISNNRKIKANEELCFYYSKPKEAPQGKKRDIMEAFS